MIPLILIVMGVGFALLTGLDVLPLNYWLDIPVTVVTAAAFGFVGAPDIRRKDV